MVIVWELIEYLWELNFSDQNLLAFLAEQKYQTEKIEELNEEN